jgi:glycosyltransferase involved in cell wall biosynthesis
MKDGSGTPLLSICIPSYNRPRQLELLLRTVDCDVDMIEILICEDFSPSREEIRQRVSEFQAQSAYQVRYVENQQNKGYDGIFVSWWRKREVNSSSLWVMMICSSRSH